jgi:hypothetical protein
MKHIAKALLAVQQNLDPVHKGRKGYGYTYADLPAVINSCIDTLNANGVLMLQCPIQTYKQAAAIKTRLIHAESGEEVESVIEVPYTEQAKMSVAQTYGSAVTYARRYAIVAMLGIVTEDDDGASAGQRKPKPSAPTETAVAGYMMALNTATTLEELKAVWVQVVQNGHSTPELELAKDARKRELTEAQ